MGITRLLSLLGFSVAILFGSGCKTSDGKSQLAASGSLSDKKGPPFVRNLVVIPKAKVGPIQCGVNATYCEGTVDGKDVGKTSVEIHQALLAMTADGPFESLPQLVMTTSSGESGAVRLVGVEAANGDFLLQDASEAENKSGMPWVKSFAGGVNVAPNIRVKAVRCSTGSDFCEGSYTAKLRKKKVTRSFRVSKDLLDQVKDETFKKGSKTSLVWMTEVTSVEEIADSEVLQIVGIAENGKWVMDVGAGQ